MPADRGLCIEFESDPGFELALKSLDRVREKIELLSTRKIGETNYATVLVPEGKLGNLERIIVRYESEIDGRSGKPRNKTLVESIADIRQAVLESFWTDDSHLFPDDGVRIWWEVWVRGGKSNPEILADFQEHADKIGLDIGEQVVWFPDRAVLLARGTTEEMGSSVELLDDIAELRFAKEPPSTFAGLATDEQRDFGDELLGRITTASDDAPAVCLLDTGVNNGHPLLKESLDDEVLFTFNPDWDAADHHGHGTEMAGLALFGDLALQLEGDAPVVLEHQLESVKIMPPPRFPPTKPHLYGAVTGGAIAKAEIERPERSRAVCMPVTSRDYRDRGLPSCWSAELDQICAGVDEDTKRLVFVSGGNVQENEWRYYPNYNDVAQVQDPGQSWNAITVGAFTTKSIVADPDMKHWSLLARPGTLSPSSSTSVSWAAQWPNKPDVVLEGGNAAVDPADGSAAPLDDLALLTTHWKPFEKSFVPTWATSAATAQAARMAAILMARYPGLWTETIRALVVHSARWTDQMLQTSPNHDVLLRRYGYGVPDLERASWSASNVLTLVAQDEIQPYKKFDSGSVKTYEMNLHELPWPKQALEDLGQMEVIARVTLSYFVEPNPARRGWTRKHRYQSCGLRFQMKKPLESVDDFRARVSKNAQDEDDGIPFPGDREWLIGENRRNRGSVHSDSWRGPAVELAERGCVAVYPVTGWWKERPHLKRWRDKVRYALLVTIETPPTNVDIYTPVVVETDVIV